MYRILVYAFVVNFLGIVFCIAEFTGPWMVFICS